MKLQEQKVKKGSMKMKGEKKEKGKEQNNKNG